MVEKMFLLILLEFAIFSSANPSVPVYLCGGDGLPGAQSPVLLGFVKVHPRPYVAIPTNNFDFGISFLSSQYIRGCYFTDWAHYRQGIGKYDPESYIPGLCTHIFFAFGKIDTDFTAAAFDPDDLPSGPNGGYFARVNALKQQQPGLKTLLSFGGFSAGTWIFKQMASNTQNRQKFIQSAISFINQYGFDGIDIDWEYPDSSDKQNFTTLMKELKQAAGNKLVTIAVTAAASRVDDGYDVVALSKSLDFVNVMTYDYHGTWESQTGQNSPLFSAPGDTTNFNTAFSMNYWAQKGMPKSKLLVGIATYGRGWTLTNPSNTGIGAPGNPSPPQRYTGTDGFAAYYEICTMNGTRQWDDNQKVPYLVSGNLWFGYDDVQSVSGKVNWLKEDGFGGAFVWTLDFDDFTGQCGARYPLLNAILNGLSNGPQPSSAVPSNQTIAPSQRPPTTRSTARPASRPPTRPPTQIPPFQTTPGKPVTQNPNQPFSCPSPNGLYPDPMNCGMFYQCRDGIPFHMSCPPGLLWNQSIQGCDWPVNVNCIHHK